MKITFILSGFPRCPVGGCRVVYEYANRLSRMGHLISIVYCRKTEGFFDRRNVYKRIRSWLFFIYLQLFKPSPSWQRLDKNIRTFFVASPQEKYIPNSDVVFITVWPLLNYVLKYSPEKGLKCYLFQHYETWSGPKEKVDACWQSAVLHKIVISKWLYGIGEKLKASNMAYITNGIDLKLFHITNPIESRKKVISMMYSNHKWKGSAEGIEIVSSLKVKNPDLEVILFGVDSPALQLPDWIKYYRNPSQRRLVDEIYNRSVVFLCTSHYEGFALPPAEAMACGCAVVTTDCGGINDFAVHGTNALIGAVGDIETLTGYCQQLLEDDSLRIKLAYAGINNIQCIECCSGYHKQIPVSSEIILVFY